MSYVLGFWLLTCFQVGLLVVFVSDPINVGSDTSQALLSGATDLALLYFLVGLIILPLWLSLLGTV